VLTLNIARHCSIMCSSGTSSRITISFGAHLREVSFSKKTTGKTTQRRILKIHYLSVCTDARHPALPLVLQSWCGGIRRNRTLFGCLRHILSGGDKRTQRRQSGNLETLRATILINATDHTPVTVMREVSRTFPVVDLDTLEVVIQYFDVTCFLCRSVTCIYRVSDQKFRGQTFPTYTAIFQSGSGFRFLSIVPEINRYPPPQILGGPYKQTHI
jgi:hypothetical protein